MSPHLFALIERGHGHVAVLGLALLLHPVVALWRRRSVGVWTVRTAWLAAVLLLAVFAVGCWLYPSWRQHIKPGLQAAENALWLRFETKEHLAALTAALALGGAVCVQATRTDDALRPTAVALLLSAFVCGLATAGLGVWVGAGVHGAW